MKNSEIKNIYFRNNGASALYCGSALIWKKESEEIDPDNYIPKYNFSGKFTDDSTEEDWWYCYNGSSSNKVSIADKVNPETKLFDFELDQKNNYRYLIYKNDKIEYIYSIPDFNGSSEVGSGIIGYNPNLKYVKINGLNITATYKGGSIGNFISDNENLDKIEFTNVNINVDTERAHLNSFSLRNRKAKQLDISNLKVSGGELTNISSIATNCDEIETIICKNVDFGYIKSSNMSKDNLFVDNQIYSGDKFKNIIGPVYNISVKCNFSYNPLTNASAMVVINGLSEVDTTMRVTLRGTTFDTLTEEQIALATSKGWSVIRY